MADIVWPMWSVADMVASLANVHRFGTSYLHISPSSSGRLETAQVITAVDFDQYFYSKGTSLFSNDHI